jgi:hypothetical protein
MPPVEKPRLRAVASEPLLLTSVRHCSVSPAARASWAATETRERSQSAAAPFRGHREPHVGQDAFPFGVGAAGQGHALPLVVVDDGVAVLEVGKAHLVHVIGRAQALKFDGFRVAVRDRQLLRRLQQRQVVGEEERRGALAVAAVGG